MTTSASASQLSALFDSIRLPSSDFSALYSENETYHSKVCTVNERNYRSVLFRISDSSYVGWILEFPLIPRIVQLADHVIQMTFALIPLTIACSFTDHIEVHYEITFPVSVHADYDANDSWATS